MRKQRRRSAAQCFTAQLISAFVFDIRIVQSLFFSKPKFQASNCLQWLHSPVCIGPGRKLRRPVLSQRGSFYFQGISKCRWIRLPLIVYSTHVMTTVIAILHHINFHDFTDSKYEAPRNQRERIQLSAIYLPYLALPFGLLLDACFSSVYRDKQKRS